LFYIHLRLGPAFLPVTTVSESHPNVTWVRVVAFVASLALGAGGLAHSVAAKEGVEELVPAHVPLAVLTDDLAATSAAWTKTRWGSLFSRGVFAPLERELQQADVPAPLHLRPWFGIDWKELSNWKGPAALVVFGNDGRDVQAAWIFPAGSVQQAELLAQAERYFVQRRFSRQEEMVSQTRVVVFRRAANQQGSREPACFISERCFGLATSREAAAALAVQLRQRDFRSLAKVPEFAAARRPEATSTDSGGIKFWMRPLEFWKLNRPTDTAPPNPDWLAIQARQGGEALRAVGGVVTFPVSGPCEMELKGEIFLTRPLTKGARLLDFKAGKGMALPPWLEDFAILNLWQSDLPLVVSAFGQLFDEVNEPGPDGQGLFNDILDGLRDDPEGPRVDFRREVLAHLGPEMLNLSDRTTAPPPAKPALQTRGLLAVQCRNPAAVTKALERYFAADDEVKRGTIGMHPLWTIGPERSLFVEGEGKTLAPVRAVLVYEQLLLLASHPEMITTRFPPEQRSRPVAPGALPGWSDWLAKTSGPQTCVRSLILEKSWLAGAYQAASSRPNSPAEDAPGEDSPASALRFLLQGHSTTEIKAPISRFPSWQDLQSGLYATGLTLDLTPSGFQLRGGVLRPAASSP
jgi:hypothetical protein